MRSRVVYMLCVCLLMGVPYASAQWRTYADSAIYQGLNVRVDIANPVYELARTGGHTYAVEAAVNTRLMNRFYPTVEIGYAGAFLQEKDMAVPAYTGNGGYARLGLDLNPLKKHPERRSYMTVGLRAGVGMQHLATEPLRVYSPQGEWIADAWGEIVAGVQVQIVGGLHLGWAVRMKYLFTQNSHGAYTTPYYIPGFGYHNSMNWGFDYYIGYTL